MLCRGALPHRVSCKIVGDGADAARINHPNLCSCQASNHCSKSLCSVSWAQISLWLLAPAGCTKHWKLLLSPPQRSSHFRQPQSHTEQNASGFFRPTSGHLPTVCFPAKPVYFAARASGGAAADVEARSVAPATRLLLQRADGPVPGGLVRAQVVRRVAVHQLTCGGEAPIVAA